MNTLQLLSPEDCMEDIEALWVSPDNKIYHFEGDDYREHCDVMRDHLYVHHGYSAVGKSDDEVMQHAFKLGYVRMRNYWPAAKSDKCLERTNRNHERRWDIHGTKLLGAKRGKVRAILGKLVHWGFIAGYHKVYLLTENDAFWGYSGNYDGRCYEVSSLLGY